MSPSPEVEARRREFERRFRDLRRAAGRETGIVPSTGRWWLPVVFAAGGFFLALAARRRLLPQRSSVEEE